MLTYSFARPKKECPVQGSDFFEAIHDDALNSESEDLKPDVRTTPWAINSFKKFGIFKYIDEQGSYLY
jgi:hypothetical protein